MKKILIVIVIIVIGAAAAFIFLKGNDVSASNGYTFVTITRGDIENTVSSTGTLYPVSTVEIGTQVSGTIDKVLVDFNDDVRQGQTLAILDTTNLASMVRASEADILRAEAQYEQAQSDFERARKMFAKNLISEYDLTSAKTSAQTSLAALKSARESLDRAKTNLDYALIKSPIDGKVIHRNIEEGQTVAASLSTPTFFIIAEDLGQMEIQALVDESDIGRIENGQTVHFTVEAYMDEEFTGIVEQVRLQPTTILNVVNYTVIVDASNEEGLLLPGMTATVDFLIEQRQDVMLVPNAALRFQPTTEMLAEFRQNMQKHMENMPDSLKEHFGQRRPQENQTEDDQAESRQAVSRSFMGPMGMGGAMGDGSQPKNISRLWYLDQDGKLNMTMIRTGATDGKNTEIVMGRNITEDMQVISSSTGTSSSNNKNNQPRPPMGRMF